MTVFRAISYISCYRLGRAAVGYKFIIMKYLLDDNEIKELESFVKLKSKPAIAKTNLFHGIYSSYMGLEYLCESEVVDLLRKELKAVTDMYEREVMNHISTKNEFMRFKDKKYSWF